MICSIAQKQVRQFCILSVVSKEGHPIAKHVRKLSGVTKSSPPETPPEDTPWSWKWKAFGAAAVAIVVPGSFVSAIKYDPPFREQVEDFFPGPVEWLRGQLEFVGEDPDWRAYVAALEEELKEPVQVLYDSVDMGKIDPTTPISKLGAPLTAKLEFGDLQVPGGQEDTDTNPAMDPGPPEASLALVGLQRDLQTFSLWHQLAPAAPGEYGASLAVRPRDKELNKQDAEALLQHLKDRLKELEEEKKMPGMRAIDDIDDETKAVKARTKQLKKEHFRSGWWPF